MLDKNGFLLYTFYMENFTTRNKVPELCAEYGVKPMDLIRDAGLSVNVAYEWYGGKALTRYGAETLERLCSYFSAKSGRVVGISDLLEIYPGFTLPKPRPDDLRAEQVAE